MKKKIKKQKPTSNRTVVTSVRLDADILKMARQLRVDLSDLFNRRLLVEVAALHAKCPTCGEMKK